MNYYTRIWQNYAKFGGRDTRTEYWMFVLINFLIAIGISILSGILRPLAIISFLYSIALFIPSLAAISRRLHDSGRSAWWILISLVPIAGPIVLIVFLAMPAEEGENQYGKNSLMK